MQHRKLTLRALSLLLSALCLFAGVQPVQARNLAEPAAPDASTSYAFSWNEGSHFTVVEYWNAQSRAGCDYASHPWPRGELAAQRAYVLGVRQVLRNELSMESWIAANRSSTSQVRIHGAETNCPVANGTPHLDWPPHVHSFYLSIGAGGAWQHINSHHYPDSQGKITDNFIIPNLCGQSKSYHPGVGTWVDILDEKCTTAWQQRFTTAGDIEIRRSTSSAVYTIHSRGTNGDLSGVDISSGGRAIYTINITQYDPIAFRMAAQIKDFKKNVMVTENWQGNPSTGTNLSSHTTSTSSLPATNPTPVPPPPTGARGPHKAFMPASPNFTAPRTSSPGWMAAAETTYPAIRQTSLDNCALCHTGTVPQLNNYGYDFRANNHNFASVEQIDSDGDGYRNIAEIQALSFPGNKSSIPSSAPPPAPTPAPPPSGKAFYVATSGNDSNPGTETQPWRTIAKAANTLTAGQMVYVKGGTYRERLVPARSGSSGAPITFAAYPGQTPVLEGQGLSIGGYAGLVDLSSRSYIAVDGFRVQNSSGVGIFAQNARNITISRNHTYHSNGSGIGIWGSSSVVIDGNDVENSNYNGSQEALSLGGTGPFEIRYNKVHNPAATSSQPLKEGIDAKQGSHDGKIHHNEVYALQKVGLYVDAYDKHTYNIEVFANKVHDVRMGITLGAEHGGLLENIKVYNNLIWNVYYAGIRTFGMVDGYPTHQMSNIQYLFNTIYKSGTGINVGNDQILGGFVVANNLLSGNTTALDIADASKVTQVGNLNSANPLFVNAAAGDFRLAAGSPAIDKASGSYSVSTDFAGVARPKGAASDIGAYESR